jgi:hypothetical protein
MRVRARAGERPAKWSESQESVKPDSTLHLSPERHKRGSMEDAMKVAIKDSESCAIRYSPEHALSGILISLFCAPRLVRPCLRSEIEERHDEVPVDHDGCAAGRASA